MAQNYRGDPDKSALVYGHWLAGFMTGFGRVCRSVVYDWNAGEAFLREYCADHPLNSVVQGADEMLKQLSGPTTRAECDGQAKVQ